MNYCAEIAGLMAEDYRLHVAAETHKKERGRDREYQMLRIQAKLMAARENELRRQAQTEFAALNGWRPSRSRFGVKALLRGGVHDGYYGTRLDDPVLRLSLDLFDHAIFFREIVRPYRTAAIVGQPYDTKPDEARAIAAKIGLVLHVPPKVTASWWKPGATRFFCFTRREIASVQFLPEQLGEKRSET
jgi:hypothetical protein